MISARPPERPCSFCVWRLGDNDDIMAVLFFHCFMQLAYAPKLVEVLISFSIFLNIHPFKQFESLLQILVGGLDERKKSHVMNGKGISFPVWVQKPERFLHMSIIMIEGRSK